MIKKNKIPEIRAEVLLNYLYPEAEKDWIARDEGAFYRNYNYDLLSIENETKEVVMARDGYLKLLPQGILTLHDDMKGEDSAERFKAVKRRMRMLGEAFLPIDTFFFRQGLTMERQVAELLEDRVPYILRTYFGYDISKEESPLVREAALLLPYVSHHRGDFGFVSMLLGALMHCRVEMIQGRYSHTDTTRRWLPKVRFELLIPGLTPDEYCEKDTALEPLRQFICEWFIPIEVVCEIVIKEHGLEQQTNTRLTLGYNTELNQ